MLWEREKKKNGKTYIVRSQKTNCVREVQKTGRDIRVRERDIQRSGIQRERERERERLKLETLKAYVDRLLHPQYWAQYWTRMFSYDLK